MARGNKKILLLPDSNRCDLERKLGHVFSDPNLLWEALQAADNGVIQIGDRKIDNGNKKMALLGDAILQLALLNDWFESGESRSMFSLLHRSFCFTLRIKIDIMETGVGNGTVCAVGNHRNLEKCGRDNGLAKFITPNYTCRKSEIPRRTMTATVEALLGAVFIDSAEDLKAVKTAMKGLGLIN